MCFAPLAFALIGYSIIYFASGGIISPVLSIVSMMSTGGEQLDSSAYTDIYSGEIFVNYTDSVPSSTIKFPMINTKYGEISIENTDVNCSLIFGDSAAMLKKGACQYMGSSFPGLGSTVLVSGHNNSYFSGLKDAKIGDTVTIRTNYGVYTYKITSTDIKLNTDKSAYDLSADKENLVLYTCYPFNALGLTAQRYFVYCEYVSGPHVLLHE